jgi:DNA repair protein SbcC/Rad50
MITYKNLKLNIIFIFNFKIKMKIRLINFLCYEDKTFDFGDKGMVLLTGPSGTGKTSILRGIFFALFGKGNKLQNQGKTSTKVEFSFDTIKIVRTKRPNRLVVNDSYEDDSGQEIINKIFGKTFKTSGYIQQNNLSSFILMSPIEKLSFLENFAFNNINLTEIKERCKNYISKKHDDHLTSVSELNMITNILSNMGVPEKISFPLKCKKQQQKLVIKNQNTLLKNSKILIKRSKKRNKSLSIELTDVKIVNATLQEKNNQIEKVEEKIILNISEKKKNNYKGDDFLENTEKKLQNILEQQEFILLQNNYKNDSEKLDKMYKEERSLIEQKISVIEETLWKLYAKDEINDTIEELSECLSDVKKIIILNEELSDIPEDTLEDFQQNKKENESNKEQLSIKKSELIDLKMRENVYNCPKCESVLCINDNKLYKIEKIISSEELKKCVKYLTKDILELDTIIRKTECLIVKQKENLTKRNKLVIQIQNIRDCYQDDLPDINELKMDLKSLHKYEAEHIEFEKKKNYLKKCILNDSLSSSYNSFKKNCIEMENKLIKHKNNNQESYCELTEEELRSVIETEKELKNKRIYLSKKHKDLIKEKEELYESVIFLNKQHEEKHGVFKTNEEIEDSIKEVEKEISNQENKQNKHEENIKKIGIWENYKKELEKYNRVSDKINEVEKKEKEERLMYSSSLKLKNKILESESIAMVNIIDIINTHSRIYLESFFPDNPISVQLQTFKEVKKVSKPCINMTIEYKGMECDLMMLSGGELSRVVLAYTLSLAEIFNTPLLLLDECTSSLDEDLTSVVFDSIKENFNGKLVLIIAHQVISGTFDNLINL